MITTVVVDGAEVQGVTDVNIDAKPFELYTLTLTIIVSELSIKREPNHYRIDVTTPGAKNGRR